MGRRGRASDGSGESRARSRPRRPASRSEPRQARAKAEPAGAPDKSSSLPAGAGRTPPEALLELTDLEQIKVFADPLRIRILELLGEERTTKQVAEILGEPPTRLYHHVAALERVGLIRLARTRQARGALEKYYVAVAKAFSADPRLFSSREGAQAREATHGIAVQFLENTAAELRALLEADKSPKTLEEEGVLSFLEVRGSARELRAIRAKLAKILKDCMTSKAGPPDPGPGYRLTIAYFPLAGRSRTS